MISSDSTRLCKFLTLEQQLRIEQQKFTARPIGIWPLSQAFLVDDTTTDMTVIHQDIGIDYLSTPAGLFGSPLISSLKGIHDIIPIDSHLILDYKASNPSWSGITILLWLRFDDKVLQIGDVPIMVRSE